jgi:hypothetical protein
VLSPRVLYVCIPHVEYARQGYTSFKRRVSEVGRCPCSGLTHGCCFYSERDVNALGFVPDLSMRCVGDNSIGGGDVHGPTTTFPRMRLSNRYTTSYGCRYLVERVTRPLGHQFLQAIEELARTSIEQVLNLLDWNEVLNLKLNHEYGGVPKTGSRTADLARALQQVAMAKLDLNKTQSVCGGYRAIGEGGGRLGRGGGRPTTLGRAPMGLHLIHGPLGRIRWRSTWDRLTSGQ